MLISLFQPLFIFIAVFVCIFLFWRAGRHELFESNMLFDLLIVVFAGGLIFGRIFDFLLFPNVYHFSITRLVFFNVYGSFNWWGGFFGAITSGQIYLKSQKINFWQIFDLASAPIVFGMVLSSLGFYIVGLSSRNIFGLNLYKFLGYLIIFWLLKNLARQKRHHGFFACFLLVSISFFNILFVVLKGNPAKFVQLFLYELAVPSAFLVFGVVSWYLLAKRQPWQDLKMIFAAFLLAVFKLRRMITSIKEADNVSKVILLSPYYLAKSLLLLVKLIGREIAFSFVDLVSVFRGKK